MDLVRNKILTNCFTRCVGISALSQIFFNFPDQIVTNFHISKIIMPLSCRFYRQKYPEVEDVVMVDVRSIGEMGAYVHLLEYNNIEGLFYSNYLQII